MNVVFQKMLKTYDWLKKIKSYQRGFKIALEKMALLLNQGKKWFHFFVLIRVCVLCKKPLLIT